MKLAEALEHLRNGEHITEGSALRDDYVEIVSDSPLSDTALTLPYVLPYLKVVTRREGAPMWPQPLPDYYLDSDNWGVVRHDMFISSP